MDHSVPAASAAAATAVRAPTSGGEGFRPQVGPARRLACPRAGVGGTGVGAGKRPIRSRNGASVGAAVHRCVRPARLGVGVAGAGQSRPRRSGAAGRAGRPRAADSSSLRISLSQSSRRRRWPSGCAWRQACSTVVWSRPAKASPIRRVLGEFMASAIATWHWARQRAGAALGQQVLDLQPVVVGPPSGCWGCRSTAAAPQQVAQGLLGELHGDRAAGEVGARPRVERALEVAHVAVHLLGQERHLVRHQDAALWALASTIAARVSKSGGSIADGPQDGAT